MITWYTLTAQLHIICCTVVRCYCRYIRTTLIATMLIRLTLPHWNDCVVLLKFICIPLVRHFKPKETKVSWLIMVIITHVICKVYDCSFVAMLIKDMSGMLNFRAQYEKFNSHWSEKYNQDRLCENIFLLGNYDGYSL